MRAISSIILIFLAGTTAAFGSAGKFVCTSNDVEILSGVIDSIPGRGEFSFLGRKMEASWKYLPKSFFNVHGAAGSDNSDNIEITLTGNGKLYGGNITVSSDFSFGHIFDLSAEDNFWHRRLTCVWH